MLILLELSPGNIALMVVVDQNFPLSPIAAEVVAHDPLSASLKRHARAPPAVGVGASVHRVRQYVIERMVDWRLPLDRAFAATRHDHRDEDIFLSEPQQDLTNRMKFREFVVD